MWLFMSVIILFGLATPCLLILRTIIRPLASLQISEAELRRLPAIALTPRIVCPAALTTKGCSHAYPAYLWLMPLRLLPSSRKFAWCAIGLIVYTSAMVFAKHPIQGVLQLAQKNNGLV